MSDTKTTLRLACDQCRHEWDTPTAQPCPHCLAPGRVRVVSLPRPQQIRGASVMMCLSEDMWNAIREAMGATDGQ